MAALRGGKCRRRIRPVVYATCWHGAARLQQTFSLQQVDPPTTQTGSRGRRPTRLATSSGQLLDGRIKLRPITAVQHHFGAMLSKSFRKRKTDDLRRARRESSKARKIKKFENLAIFLKPARFSPPRDRDAGTGPNARRRTARPCHANAESHRVWRAFRQTSPPHGSCPRQPPPFP